MRADDLAAPTGNSFKFNNVGDSLEGTVAYVGDWQTRTNKFNNIQEQVAKIGVDPGTGEIVYVYPVRGSIIAKAIADGIRAAGVPELVPGQRLKLTFYATKDTGKGNPAKLFDAAVSAGRRPDDPF